MKAAVRRALRLLPGYQFVRHRFRSLTESEFRNRAELLEWITTGTRLQNRLHLEPIIFRNGKAYVQSADGIEYWWNPEIEGGILDLEFGSDFERLERECVLSYVAKSKGEESVFMDIGGNCGLYSLNVTQRYPKAHAYCFEPVPTSQAMITINGRHNGLADRITLVSVALGDRPTTVRMTASYSAMDHILPGNDKEELSPLIIEVPMITLDDFVKERALNRVDFIKCDVEGAELLVFKGAQGVLARFHPPILVEIESRHTKRFAYTPEDLDKFLRTFDYVPCIPVPSDEVKRLPSIRNGIEQGYSNFLYLHTETAH